MGIYQILQVMGGYDFPGSSSNVDLTALTGWIPERVGLKKDGVNTDSLYKRMLDGKSICSYWQSTILLSK